MARTAPRKTRDRKRGRRKLVRPLDVIHVRIQPKNKQRLSGIAKRRGHPHTLSSVAAEMISLGLDADGLGL